MRRVLACLVLTLLVTGCGLAPRPSSDEPMVWLARHGGPADAALTPRADRAAWRLAAEGRCPIQRVLVADTDQVGAWSWPDGTVVLTQRVVAELAADELTAVLAHEVGHLERDPDSVAAALAGHSGGLRTEQAADRAGASLLASLGLDPAAMPRMLRRIAAMTGHESAAGGAALRRATILEADGSSGRAGQACGTMPRCSR